VILPCKVVAPGQIRLRHFKGIAGIMVKGKRAVRSDQRSFLPLRVLWCDPIDLGADSGLVCRAEDGCDYLIKDKISGESTAETPHCEWFCSSLAETLGIAVPPHRVLEMIDGAMVFGSRWEGGVLESKPWEAEHWWEKVQRGEIRLDDIKSTPRYTEMVGLNRDA